MNILVWIVGALVLLFLAGIWLFFGIRRQAAGKKYEITTPAYTEEYAQEITGDLQVTKPKSQPQHPEIPWNYGVDRLVLMVRDPNWLFAYWELTAAKHEEFNQQYGPSAWESSRSVLRVYDVTGVDPYNFNTNNYIDFSINEYVDNWHIEVSRPNSTFYVDLGRVFPDGRFVTLLRSNIVQTPSMEISNLMDEEWMWIEGIYRSITRLHPGSSPLIVDEINQRMGLVPLSISSPEFASSKN